MSRYNDIKGKNYNDKLTVKEIGVIFRKYLKENYKNIKFSVKTTNTTINVSTENKLYFKDIQDIQDFINSYNFDYSDVSTDYFHQNFILFFEYPKGKSVWGASWELLGNFKNKYNYNVKRQDFTTKNELESYGVAQLEILDEITEKEYIKIKKEFEKVTTVTDINKIVYRINCNNIKKVV